MLTDKEIEVLETIERRRVARERWGGHLLAKELGNTDGGIEQLLGSARRKLGVTTTADAVDEWTRLGPSDASQAPGIGRVDAGHGSVAFWDSGGHGTPVIVLQSPRYSHVELELQSFGRLRWYWLLSQLGIRVIRLDPAGVGASVVRKSDIDADICCVAEKLEIRRFGLLGEFSSAIIAQSFATRNPGRVSHLGLWHAGYVGFHPRAVALETNLSDALEYAAFVRANFAASYLVGVSERDQEAHVRRVLANCPTPTEWSLMKQLIGRLEEAMTQTERFWRKSSAFPSCSFYRSGYDNTASVEAAKRVGEAVGGNCSCPGANSLPEFGESADVRWAASALSRFFCS